MKFVKTNLIFTILVCFLLKVERQIIRYPIRERGREIEEVKYIERDLSLRERGRRRGDRDRELESEGCKF